jgi:general secretion pathway protein K
MAILVVGFSGDARTQLQLARNQNEAATAQAIADAGVSFAILGVFDPSPATQWRADGRQHVIRYGGGVLQISLQDEGGKIDINVAPLALLNNLFQVVGIPNAQQLARAIAAARPQRSPDDIGRSPEVETAPAFAAVEELRRIPGMDKASYDSVAPFVTVYSGSPRFDPMTAPRAVLLSLPNAQEDAIDRFIVQRAAASAIAADFAVVADHPDFASAAPLRVFTVRSEAETATGARFVRAAVVTLLGPAETPYRILAWRSVVRDDGSSTNY